MIVKLGKLVSCSSEHPSFPARNLCEHRSGSIGSLTWLCEEPGIKESEAIFELAEPSQITGVDIGNSRCCSVKIAGASSNAPEEWVIIVSHTFMSFNDADHGLFKDQVQLFTKKEISAEVLNRVFNRVKVTCSQPANPRVLFGLSFLILRTDDKLDSGNLDTFGRFKVKEDKGDNSLDKFKEKYIQLMKPKPNSFKVELAKQIESNRVVAVNEKRDETPSRKRLSLKLITPANAAIDENKSTETDKKHEIKKRRLSDKDEKPMESSSKQHSIGILQETRTTMSESINRGRLRCSLCLGNEENVLCKTCNLLVPDKDQANGASRQKPAKPKKPVKNFSALFENVTFSLSGYQNPKRDEIRRKALAMGAKYLVNPNGRNHNCTHLVCAFKNTPKYNQLKGSVKIIDQQWVEDCYDKKTRFPWRRYALDKEEKDLPESEEEVDADTGSTDPLSIYDQDTDSDY
ncbi:DNA repair protein XRCC1 [Neodiprion lecontei]|uniref:DNA repair protein XRCC1 n=1 Tax=Neodiprion lecontei TaxID=441921 RepID=A0A6J0CE55_NEOLC|nr:DNA repair protein XRCC1 [Neodiprion lecontei]